MKLYTFFRSSAAYRLRIALNLKQLSCETTPINLRDGEQFSDSYRAVNPQARVPSLDVDGDLLIQSMAIMEYLEETHPEPPLLPSDPVGRARVRGLADLIACDIHPLNNLSVLVLLENQFKLSKDDVARWYCHWIEAGFAALEPLLAGASETGGFCHGDSPGLADICLVPQVFNARRFDCPLDAYPTLMGIFESCMKLPAFDAAQPSKQPDAG